MPLHACGMADATVCPIPAAPIGRPESRCDAHADVDLPSLLTVVLNTSPGVSNPSTRLLEEVLASFALVPGLLSCRLIIVADGYKLREKAALKKGAATPAISVAYEHFLTRVDSLTRSPHSHLRGAELLALEQRHGCAHAFRRGLSRVTTPFVMAVQHDRPFVRPVDACELLRAFLAPGGEGVHCIALPTALSAGYEDRSVSRGLPRAFFRERTREVAGLRLVPLAAFLDSTHIARCAWFRERVFGPARHAPLPRGAFLEDTMGQAQLRELRDGGSATHEWYGTFVLNNPGLGAVVAHLDCHDRFSGSGSWAKWRWHAAHTPEERWAELEDAPLSPLHCRTHPGGPPRLASPRVPGFGEEEEGGDAGDGDADAEAEGEAAAGGAAAEEPEAGAAAEEPAAGAAARGGESRDS